MGKDTLDSMMEYFFNEQMIQMVVSGPWEKGGIQKVKIRPVLIKDTLMFQAEELDGKQVFHKNSSKEELISYVGTLLPGVFRQVDITSSLGTAVVLVSKKGQTTVKMKKEKSQVVPPQISEHNRKKKYVLEEGIPVPFLVDLGVMTKQGTVVSSRYDKFRQINRFLEFIEDILPKLDKSKETVILDFGCGKSYLTFAMYYYLHQLKGYPIRIVGLDLKEEVIARCNRLAIDYGYETLQFYHGDIASYEGVEQVDMVVTLHACDTATDYALEKAVRLGAKVILSVPCCQHELNGQMKNQLLQPVFQYGLIRERMAALYTDALRAEILEACGYRTQILEFVDMEHTPKNLLIRAVWNGKPKDNQKEIQAILDFLQVEPALFRLICEGDTPNICLKRLEK